jgi:hypothetical protein
VLAYASKQYRDVLTVRANLWIGVKCSGLKLFSMAGSDAAGADWRVYSVECGATFAGQQETAGAHAASSRTAWRPTCRTAGNSARLNRM